MREQLMPQHEVVIAGGGPTGLMLAAELALAGIDVAIVERRANQELAGARAGGLSARSLEVLDQRGLAERFLAEGQMFQVTGFGTIRLDISDFPTRHNYGLALWQNHIERILAEWVSALPVTFYRAREVSGFVQNESGVDVQLSSGERVRAQYLVGCDGGRSVVRKTAGITFPGWDATSSSIIAEVEMTQQPPMGIHRTGAGVYSFGRREYEIVDGQIIFATSGAIRVMLPELTIGSAVEPTLEDLRDLLNNICGTDYGLQSASWISRFTDTTRQAATYRQGRVLLAGDAAHVHSPIGGQGLNTGLQDAVNLGWKLAQVVKHISPERLLDTYHDERHAVGARVLQKTMAQVALHRSDDRTTALRETVGALLAMDEPRKHLAAEMSGLGIRYDLGEGHALLGRRMPDLDIVVGANTVRVFHHLHNARAVLIDFGHTVTADIGAWVDRVQTINATYDGVWELPALGVVDAPGAVLVRPDGYVAWVGQGNDAGLTDALTRWFGAADAA